MKPSSTRNFGSIRCRVLESSSSCRNLVGIVAHVSVYVATLDVLDFSEPVSKLPVCTPARHLKHHVNLTINNHNYGGPQLPHQNQMHTAKNTNRSQQITNRSQQIQIAHSKLQIAHSKLQIAHSKFKSPTANSNRSQ